MELGAEPRKQKFTLREHTVVIRHLGTSPEQTEIRRHMNRSVMTWAGVPEEVGPSVETSMQVLRAMSDWRPEDGPVVETTLTDEQLEHVRDAVRQAIAENVAVLEDLGMSMRDIDVSDPIRLLELLPPYEEGGTEESIIFGDLYAAIGMSLEFDDYFGPDDPAL
jgi:hypothetical protein